MRAIEAVTPPGETAALCQSIGVSRASLYRRRRLAPPSTPTRPRAPSPRALGAPERQAVLDVLHSERFVDQAPAAVHATLLEEQTYLCSPRTMYRVLAAAREVRERRAPARHPVYTKPELVATGPNQVWSWDITKLKGPIPSLDYSLYVILDLFSRYDVGWMVALHENAHLAERLIEQTCTTQSIGPHQLTIHADRGAPMRSKLAREDAPGATIVTPDDPQHGVIRWSQLISDDPSITLGSYYMWLPAEEAAHTRSSCFTGRTGELWLFPHRGFTVKLRCDLPWEKWAG